MVRGFYTLASGMLTAQRQLETISNNVSNVRTPGFKRQTLTSSSFSDTLTARLEQGSSQKIGKGSIVRYADVLHTDYGQSSYTETSIPFDFALVGEGFFRLQSFDETMEQTLLTRSGHFSLDGDGYLVQPNGGRLLGENGPIQLDSADFAVDENGYIYVGTEDSPADRISLAFPTDYQDLTTYREGYFLDNNAQNEEQPTLPEFYATSILQGRLEDSNVDMAEETSSMMATSRSFQSYSQAIKIMDRIINKSVTEIGRV